MAELKILRISQDPTVRVDDSAAFVRIKKDGELVQELHVIVLGGAQQEPVRQVGKNVWIYAIPKTLSQRGRAARLGKKIVLERAFVRGKSLIIADDVLECGAIGASIKKRWRIPLMVECNTDISRISFLKKMMLKHVVRRADAIAVSSRYMADIAAHTLGLDAGQLHILPPFIDIEEVEAARIRFDLHGRYGWRMVMLTSAPVRSETKNFSMVIEVLAKLVKHFPQIGLMVVGAGPQEQMLAAQAEKLGVRDRLAFAEIGDDWASYFKTADIFVQTALFESYGEDLVRAGLAGLPLVTTPVGIASELENGRDALICPPGDAEYMFRAIYDLLTTNGLRELLRARAKEVMKEKVLEGQGAYAEVAGIWDRVAASVAAHHG